MATRSFILTTISRSAGRTSRANAGTRRRGTQPLASAMTSSKHVYEVCPRKDKRGVDLISDALPLGRLWYDGPNAATNAIGYTK